MTIFLYRSSALASAGVNSNRFKVLLPARALPQSAAR